MYVIFVRLCVGHLCIVIEIVGRDKQTPLDVF